MFTVQSHYLGSSRTSPFDFRYIFEKLIEKSGEDKEIITSFISEIRCTRDGANMDEWRITNERFDCNSSYARNNFYLGQDTFISGKLFYII